MKKLTCLLLSFLIFVSPILAQNPCEDSTYLELKKKKLDGLWTMWYENGQMREEGTYKDGKEIESTSWYENGQKWLEGTYKNGVLITAECWDEDGNEKDCPEE